MGQSIHDKYSKTSEDSKTNKNVGEAQTTKKNNLWRGNDGISYSNAEELEKEYNEEYE